jgi:capsular polysaccharide biosynthesis protein
MATSRHYDARSADWDGALDVVTTRLPAQAGGARRILTPTSPMNVVLAIVLGVVAGGAAAGISLGASTVYSSKATLLIDQPAAVSRAVDDGPLRKLSLLRIKYTDLADTPGIAGPAAARLGLSTGDVARSTTAVAPAASLAIVVSGRDATRAGAERRANAVAASMATYADQEQQGLNVPPTDRYNLTIVETAGPATTTRVQPTGARAGRAALLLGLISATLAYLILQALSPDRRLA